jgi:uncharacterized membrane protein YhaH (DUF805 family)
MSYYPPGTPQAGYGPGAVPLQAPLYGATIGQAFTRFWKKYATFSGRASRSEFWWWALIGFIISSVLSSIGLAIAGGDMTTVENMTSGSRNALSGLWGLVTLIPSLALGVRRLHDTNRSGWWLLIALVPVVGVIVLIVFYASSSNPAGARYDAPFAP